MPELDAQVGFIDENRGIKPRECVPLNNHRFYRRVRKKKKKRRRRKMMR
jgi:hypothetical protein